jgi:arylformamidase
VTRGRATGAAWTSASLVQVLRNLDTPLQWGIVEGAFPATAGGPPATDRLGGSPAGLVRFGGSGVTRRAFLGGALAAAAACAPRVPLFTGPMQTYMPPGVTPGPKGPPVFLDYDEEELAAAYEQGPWAPNREQLVRGYRQDNAAALARLGPPRRFAYGWSEIEQLDHYATDEPNAPVMVFIRGGAWRGPVPPTLAFEQPPVALQAEMFVDYGAHYIALHFTNVLATGGDLVPMAEQVRRGVAWVYRNARSFGGNPERLYVSGASSGGHLAGVVLTTDWEREFGLPADTVKGYVCISGMYDLHPVSLSARRTYVDFTPQVIEALSPIRHLERVAAPVILAYGTEETPEFQRQSREFAAALEAAGKSVTLLVGEGYNHFEIQATFWNPYGLLGRAVLEQMELRTH